ncbi:MAG TPA: chloride channel protein [Gemmatimonadales bacterium]|nr:chloride channel protein [Gemmatimonadales bacterium]
MPKTATGRQRRRQRQLIVDTILIGVAGALAAQLFVYLLKLVSGVFLQWFAGYQAPGVASEGGPAQQTIGPHGMWLVPIATTVGGLIVGIMVQWLAPETEGHGTDTVVRSFHRNAGRLRARVPAVKMAASALTIGSGGAAGREGPIALITAGVASWYASVTNRSDRDRRLLLLIGMAAGLSAIFRSPVGTAIFAIEVLYSDMEFEAGTLLYTMLGSVVAYAVNGLFVGWQPLFHVPANIPQPGFTDFGWYLLLGIAAGVLGTLLPIVFYGIRDLFRALPVPKFTKPAIGGLIVGLMGVAYPQVLGGGYGWMQHAIDGRIALATLAVLVFGKMIALALSVSSGGSGGVFAPSLFVGAMLGALFAAAFHQPTAAFAVVGMAAVFAGAAHVPIATLMMVTEMTGGYSLLVPAALAVMISYLVQTRLSSGWRRYTSLYEAQVTTRADSPAHHSDHLRIALQILKQHEAPDLRDAGELDLVGLLASGLPVELPDHRRLTIGVLRKDSPYVGKDVGKDAGRLDADTTIIAIIRGEHMVVPRADTKLEVGDRMMLVTTDEGLKRLQPHIDKW